MFISGYYLNNIIFHIIKQVPLVQNLSYYHFSHYASGGPIVSRLSVLQSEWNFEPKDKHDHCLKELLETEANYVDVLNMLRRNFIRKISKMKDTDKKLIFMNIRELGEIHGAFYTGLVECVTKKSHKRIGEIFVEFKEKFLKYGEYCSDLPKAQELLGTLYDKDEDVRKEIEECEENANEGRFRLRDLLAVPMQRILKYHLLLGSLCGSESNTDCYLRQAYEAMLDVSSYINEVKRDSEHLQGIPLLYSLNNLLFIFNIPLSELFGNSTCSTFFSDISHSNKYYRLEYASWG